VLGFPVCPLKNHGRTDNRADFLDLLGDNGKVRPLIVNTPRIISSLLMAVSVIGGGLISAFVVRWQAGTQSPWDPLPLILGAVFGALGWLLAENLGDAVVILFGTSLPGMVILAYLDNGTFRILIFAFLCGFNIGKLTGGIYREFT
jgi:hypothetical protein